MSLSTWFFFPISFIILISYKQASDSGSFLHSSSLARKQEQELMAVRPKTAKQVAFFSLKLKEKEEEQPEECAQRQIERM